MKMTKEAKERARIRSAKWRATHPEEKEYQRQYHRLWYARNRKKVYRYVKNWVSANKEYMQQWQRDYAAANAAKIKAYKHQYWLKNRERLMETNRRYRARKKSETCQCGNRCQQDDRVQVCGDKIINCPKCLSKAIEYINKWNV